MIDVEEIHIFIFLSAIDAFAWYVGYPLFYRMKETQGFKEADKTHTFT